MRYILLFLISFFSLTTLSAQTKGKEKTVVKKAHDKKVALEDFSNTHQDNFKIKVFTVDEAVTNQTHHWFLQLLSPRLRYINFASIEVTGHLKSNPEIDFNYHPKSIIRLCQEGKYIIGFVNVKEPGIYSLDIAIENYGTTDTYKTEIYIGEKQIEHLSKAEK